MGNKAKATATNTVVVQVNTEKKTRRSRRRAPTKQPQVAQTTTMPIREIIRESPQMSFSPFMQSLYQPYPEHTKPNTVHAPAGMSVPAPNTHPAPIPETRPPLPIPESRPALPIPETRQPVQSSLSGLTMHQLRTLIQQQDTRPPRYSRLNRAELLAFAQTLPAQAQLNRAVEQGHISARRGTGS